MSEPRQQTTGEDLTYDQDDQANVTVPEVDADVAVDVARSQEPAESVEPAGSDAELPTEQLLERTAEDEDCADDASTEETASSCEEAEAEDDASAEETASSCEEAETEDDASAEEADAGGSDATESLDDAQKSSPPDDPTSEEPSTVRMPQVDPEGREEVDTSLGDVARTAGKYARGRLDRLKEFFAAHLVLVGCLCVFLLVSIFAGVMFARNLASMPDVESVIRDARSHYATASCGQGSFGTDESLALTSVTVSSRQKEKDDMNACTAKVELLYASSSVESSQRATLGYVRKDGIWECVEAATPTDTIFSATSGISDSTLLSNIDTILRKAETAMDSSDGSSSLSLLTLYRDANITVVDRFFDESAQSYDVKLHLERRSTFTAYECNVTASFAFRQGTGVWELTKAVASSDAKEVALTPLIGTWQGSFQTQDSSGGKCLSAKEGGITISIKSVNAGKISGTFSGIAHFHTPPQTDAERSDEDVTLTDVPFEGKVDASSSAISFVCSTPEDARGRITLKLTFGSSDDPELATASLTSEFDYEDIMLFIPYQRTATFTDAFTLTKA